MPWIQFRITTDQQHAPAFEDLLTECGAVSVTYLDAEDQPVYEPELGTTPLWKNTVVIGLFRAQTDVDEVVSYVEDRSPVQPMPSHRVEILEDKDWEREWMTHFHPMQFGERLWVCPSWKEVPHPEAVNLMLDPGLAFGTGTHPTTALCLRWLDAQHDINGKTVIDYGCGSGILAIAALLLGAKDAVGVDLDPQALIATQDNAQRNNIDPALLHTYLPDEEPQKPAEIILANILSGPLTQLAPKLARLTKSGGYICLSGLLEEQAADVLKTYSEWFDMNHPETLDGWAMLYGRKR